MGRRPDLAAMLDPLLRALLSAENDVLSTHGLTMWAYAVLLGLGPQPIRTQAALADAIGADPTRIIAVLDDLQARGLISRQPDPADRRARLVSSTREGRRLRDSAQTAIQQGEERLLATLEPTDRTGFLNTLQQLWATPALQELRGEPSKSSQIGRSQAGPRQGRADQKRG